MFFENGEFFLDFKILFKLTFIMIFCLCFFSEFAFIILLYIYIYIYIKFKNESCEKLFKELTDKQYKFEAYRIILNESEAGFSDKT
jgi:hypothetical protein